MKRILTAIAITLVITLFAVSCTGNSEKTPEETGAPKTISEEIPPSDTETENTTTAPQTTTSPATAETTTPTSVPTKETPTAERSVSISYTCKSNDKRNGDISGKESAVLLTGTNLGAGDTVKIKLSEGEKYIKLSFSSVFKDAIIYLPDGEFTYTFPNNFTSYMPSAVVGMIKASYPTQSELSTVRNLALNPYDVTIKNSTVYPHAYSNNNYNTAEFGAHNAIDGMTRNTAHGTYPYQSWGPNSTVKSTDTFRIDFGREVTLSELVTFIRADFSTTGQSHDAYFSEFTVKFSDGSSKTFKQTRTADGQHFALDGVLTTYIEITEFVTEKANSDGWAGFTEIEVYGSEPSDV